MVRCFAKVLIAAALVSAAAACNTVAGIGEDVSAAGHGISRGADQVKRKM